MAFALLHPKHHALGVNVADLQRDNFHRPQTGPVGNAERRLVLGTGGRLQQAQHLLGREHARQLARLVDEYEMSRRLRPVERYLEEEPQHRHRRVDGRRLNAARGQVQLERAQVFRSRGVGDRPKKAASFLTARM